MVRIHWKWRSHNATYILSIGRFWSNTIACILCERLANKEMNDFIVHLKYITSINKRGCKHFCHSTLSWVKHFLQFHHWTHTTDCCANHKHNSDHFQVNQHVVPHYRVSNWFHWLWNFQDNSQKCCFSEIPCAHWIKISLIVWSINLAISKSKVFLLQKLDHCILSNCKHFHQSMVLCTESYWSSPPSLILNNMRLLHFSFV